MRKWPTVKLKEGVNPWICFMRQKVRQNDSLNFIIDGKTGSGKSWSALILARMYDPQWDISNCYFKFSELMKDMANGKFKSGSFIIIDEAGIDLNNISWQSEINRGASLIFQTMRSRNLILCMTTPYLSFLSKSTRKLLGAQFTCMGHNKHNMNIIMPRVLEYNGNIDKWFRKRLLVQGGKIPTLCNFIKVPKPDKELIIQYEVRKKQFTDDLFGTIASRLEVFEKKSRAKALKPSGADLTAIQESVVQMLKQGMKVSEIAKARGVSERGIYNAMTSLRKKGIKIQRINDDNGRLKGYSLENLP